MSDLQAGDRVRIDPESVILPEGQSYALAGTVSSINRLRAYIEWDDGTTDDWYVGDLEALPPPRG